jgi:hypothetical protein
MISTENLTSLPDKLKLYQICKSISVLDAIFAENWNDRYYSFNSKWSDTEEFFEMLNGAGDQILILFHPEGCVINGMTHEYYPRNKEKLTIGLPNQFQEFIFGEPVNSIGTTFCVWTDSNSKWTCGEIANFDDGSSEVLNIFDGNPTTYFNWATEYFEPNFQDNNSALDTIKKIYRGEPLVKDMVYSLNKDFKHWEQLSDDLKEINYPSNFGN